MLAEFLHFYPGYRLDDLRRLSVADFIYLVGGMLDVTAPEATESTEERVSRKVREMGARAHETARGVGG